jgi:O-antigen/teichoic acid export membrane protein
LEKKTHLFAYLAWVAAIVNLVFNWILIPYFGAAGAAIATLISYALISSSYLYYTQKLHPIYVSWNKLFIFLLISAFFALISYVLMSQSFSFELVTLKIIVSLCFIVIGWFLLPIKSIKRV